MDDSQPVGPLSATTVAAIDVNTLDVEVQAAATNFIDTTKIKRKRGRPPKIQGNAGHTVSPPQSKKRDEEDVCFICFDGGSLVLCDRRGCPKAYHPSCIKRDETFFSSKTKWNCGWHICSSCQRVSQYMCYTCTYSSCKGCIKDADYVGVRGNKGFCGTCLKTIMLIENIALENTERVQVDFDDKTSWEYLFKIYWIYLKDKLSLTIDELTNAKNAWRGDDLHKAKTFWKEADVETKEVSSRELYHRNGEKVTCLDDSCGNVEENLCKRRKTMDEPDFLNEKSLPVEKSGFDKIAPLPEGIAWATKELLELVSHMRNGDTSVLSQFEVQALLEEYIRKNNLHDPRQKSQIICDSRLATLFGKPCVDHFEMLKLLDYHSLIKEKSPADNTVRSGIAETVCGLKATRSIDGQSMVGKDRHCKTRKKLVDGSQTSHNSDEYAAIDVHNINLIYLKHSLMETLMGDPEKFHEKVVGSFVRIRIPGGDQKPDIHRLVQVVGTSKVAESYTVGSRTTDIMLEILNLNKKEFVSIDVISNQEFSEEECKHLHMSIKCGLFRKLKVGEIQDKAMALNSIKVNDWLEAEILQLNHLRDRASEKGHRKELREFAEKLELLKSQKERQRRLLEIPDIHADPNMDTNQDPEEDAGESSEKKQGDNMQPRNPGVGRKGKDLNSPLREDLNDVGNRAEINITVCEERRNTHTTFYVARDGTTRVNERGNESTWSQGGGALGLNGEHTSKNQFDPSGSVKGDRNSQAEVQSESLPGVASAIIPPPLSSSGEQSGCDFETEKLWHYEDPFGHIRGPFSIMELRKWSTSGLFPLDFRVWRINEKQDDSILLTDALVGPHPKQPLHPANSHLLPQEATVASNDTGKEWENGPSHHCSKSVQNDVRVHGAGDSDIISKNRLGSHSSTRTKTLDVAMTNSAQAQSSLQGSELSNDGKSLASQSHIWGSLPSTSSSSKLFGTLSLEVRASHGDGKWGSNPSNGDSNSFRIIDSSTNLKESAEKGEQSASGQSSQSSGQNWRPQLINSSSGWDSNTCFASVSKSIDKYEQNQEIDFSDLLSPTLKQSHRDVKGQAGENKPSVTSNFPFKDAGPSWSSASSLVVSGGHLTEVASQWGGYPHYIKPSVEEWDSNIVPASSLKPTEGGSDHAATPTSGTGPLAHSSLTHPTIDASSWQSIVPEHNEFSLVDESVSDLLAEVEAMESLGGLPSPTSKISCGRELTPGSDNDCFSPVEPFSPAADPGKSDALSSTSDVRMPTQLPVADVVLRLSHTPSHSTLTGEPLAVSQMPSQLTMADKALKLNQMPARSIAQDEPFVAWQTDGLDAQKSFSGHSSRSDEVIGDAKPRNVSVNQWKTRSEIEPLASSTFDQGEKGANIGARSSSLVGQLEAGSVVKRPASSSSYVGYGTVQGNANSNHGASRGNTNSNPGTGQGSVEQQASSNSAMAMPYGNPGILGSQPRYGGDNRYSSPRDHRNYFQGRDSGFGRDRSSGNRQPAYGAGNGGGSLKQPGKGQRVCKFYENGYCKRGASCSYLHQ